MIKAWYVKMINMAHIYSTPLLENARFAELTPLGIVVRSRLAAYECINALKTVQCSNRSLHNY
jgi:hypothetical protein